MLKFRRSIAILTTVTLLSSGLAVTPVEADTLPPAPGSDWKPQSKRGFWDKLFGRHKVPDKGSIKPGPEWKPPGRSGMAGALASPRPPGKRVKELSDKRTSTRTVYRLDDGRTQTELSSVPVRFRDSRGRWRDIDTGVTRSSGEGFSYGNDGTGFRTRFGSRSDRLVQIEAGGRGVTVGVAGAARSLTPKVSGSTVTYTDVWSGADLVYEITATGVKETIVLKRAPGASASYAFTVENDGMTGRTLQDGSVGFFAPGKDVPVFGIPRAFMTDSRADVARTPGSGYSDKVTMTASGEGSTTTVALTPDRAWLSMPGRVFPVRVDPTITVQPDVSASRDALIYSASPASNYSADPRLPVGVDNTGKLRSLVQFDLAGLVPAGTTVDSAMLSLYWDNINLIGTTTTSVPLEARPVTAAWSPSTVTWNSINAAMGAVAGTSSWNVANTNGWTSFAVTSTVRGWAAGTQPNNGFMIKGVNENAVTGGPFFAAGDYANAPAGEWPNASNKTAPKLTLTLGLPGVQLNEPRTVHANGPVLSWPAYSDPSTATTNDNLAEYQVHRSTQVGFTPSAATLVAPLPVGTVSYTDTTATPNSTAYYRIVVVRKDGQKSASQPVTAKTPPAGYADAYLPTVKDATISACTATTPHDLIDGRPLFAMGYVGGGYGKTRGLIKWDTSSIPATARVVEATGRLWHAMDNGVTADYASYALSREFDPNGATWRNAMAGTPWTQQGGDTAATPIQTFSVAPISRNSLWQNLDLTAQVKAWQADQSSNHGILLRAASEPNQACPNSGNGVLFVDSDASEQSISPRLHVRYSDTSLTFTVPTTPQWLYEGESTTVPVTITNSSAQTWPAATIKLANWWKRADGVNYSADAGRVLTSLPADLAPGQTVTVNATVKAPAAVSQDGNKAEACLLEWDLIDTSTPGDNWLSLKGQAARLEQQIGMQDPASEQLGLEDFFSYTRVATGAGGGVSTNYYSGNLTWSYGAFSHPSLGPDTAVGMSYNSLDTMRSSMGFGWSLKAATLQRLGSRLKFSPPGQTFPSEVRLIDTDGTTHTFTLSMHGSVTKPGDCTPTTCDYLNPPGLHLYLQRTGSTDPLRTWVFTAPDRKQFFFDAEGYQSATADGNGNTMSFVYELRKSNNAPTKFLQYVLDAAGRRTLELDYWAKGENYTYINDAGAEVQATNLTDPDIIDQVQSITDVDSRKIAFTYTVQGLMARMVDAAGDPLAKTFKFDYDMTQGNLNVKLIKVTDPRNRITKLDYYYPQVGDDPTLHWRSKTITDRLNGVTRIEYVDPDGPQGHTIDTTVTDPELHATRFHLDEFGRAERITDAKNQLTVLGYDVDHNVTRLQEPPTSPGATPAVSTWDYNILTGDLLRFTTAEANARGSTPTTFGYVSTLNGRVTDLTLKTSPEGRKWTYGYDLRGNLTSMTDPAGNATTTDGDFTTKFGYDGLGQLIRIVDANNHTTGFGAFGPTGQADTITDANTKTTNMSHDARGNLRTIADPLGHTRSRTYDLFNRLGTSIEQKAPGTLIVTPAPVYDGNDNVTTLTMANGAAYISTFDDNDQVTSVLAPRDEGGPERKTSYTYDKLGNQLTVTEPNGNLTATAGDFTTTNGYDEIYQLTSVRNAAGHTTRYGYDGAGNLATVVDGRKNATPDANDFTARFTYDLDHQMTAVFDAAGFHTDFGYDRDGLRTTVTDQIGVVSTTKYDARGLVNETQVPHEEGKPPTTTRFEYDQYGNQTKVISPRGVATSEARDFLTETTYDALNRPSEVAFPYDPADADERNHVRNSVLYRYDDASRLIQTELPALDPDHNSNPALSGRIISTIDYFDNDWVKKSTDPFGISTNFDYNQLGQQTSRTLIGTDQTQQTLQWAYQPDGKVKQHDSFEYAYDATGNLKTLTDRTVGATIDQWSITYDQRNLLERVNESAAGITKNSTGYRFDENGALSQRTHDRGTDDYTYDVRNLPATVQNLSGETARTTSYLYTPRGERRQETKSNGNVATNEYFLDGLLKHSLEKSRDNTTQAEHTLAYQGNLKIARDDYNFRCAGTCNGPAGYSKLYTYDPRDRVTGIEGLNGAADEFYTYDANSNVILQTLESMPLGDNFRYDRNRLTESGTLAGFSTTYAYDQFGRLKEVRNGGTATAVYGYDKFEHLTSTSQPGANGAPRSDYTYDPLGRTSSTTVTKGGTGQKTLFNYLGLTGEVLDEETGGTLTQSFEYSGTDERLGMNKIVGDPAGHSVYGSNGNGDVENITDDNGQTRATYDYTAYGSLAAAGTTGLDKPLNPEQVPYNPYWYNTKRFDTVGSTYDMDSRGYHPDTHRFVSPGTSPNADADAGLNLSPVGSNRYGFAGGNPIANPRYQPPWDWKQELANLFLPATLNYFLNLYWHPEESFSWGDLGLAVLEDVVVYGLTRGLGKVLGVPSRQFRNPFSLGSITRPRQVSGAGAAGRCLRNSFTPDTKVLMADGSRKPIADVKVGDKVKAADPGTGKVAGRTVIGLISGSDVKNMVKVTVDVDGERGGKTASLEATDGHPFWVQSRHEWVDAKDLRPGDMLRTSAGTFVKVVKTGKWTARRHVHNLAVDDLHTYYVIAGATDVLVHNCHGAYDWEPFRPGVAQDRQRPIPSGSWIEPGEALEPGGWYHFVVMRDGSLRAMETDRMIEVGDRDYVGSIDSGAGHTSLAEGASVHMAGTFDVDDAGRIIRFGRWSGHYLPSDVPGFRSLEEISRTAFERHRLSVHPDAEWEDLF